MKNINAVNFRLCKIITPQFATNEEALTEKDKIQLNTNLGFGIDENNGIGCLASFKFLSNNAPFIILDVECEYKIEKEDWDRLVNNEKTEIKFEAAFLKHLAMLTIGTARGVLHTKTENTKFNKYFLPTLNVNGMDINDMSFPLSIQK